MTFIISGLASAVSAVVSAVAAVASAVASMVAALVNSIVFTIGNTIYSIVSAINNVIGPILDVVGKVVSGILTTLGDVLTRIIESVGGVLQTIAAGVKAGVEAVTEAMMPYIENFVKKVHGIFDRTYERLVVPFKPILIPIRDSLKYIHDFITGTRAWIVTQLKPVADLVGLINDISALATIKRLLTGQMHIAEVIGDKENHLLENLAASIFVLYRDIVQTSVDTLEIIRNHYTRLRDSIDDLDERLRKDMALAVEYVKETIQGEIDKVRYALSERITPMELEVAGIERRTMDLPFFQQMLIRALK